eukprot:TRINITY_DN2093_c0_g1_i1.p1 TRINITY_DN2093_c0_g1~~TRINITY_DN2093_c0_g1_i1.p1  ORF type:complete len:643 (+),score=121.09 TRINITY_DN2093_c0_g1_i1:190-1929(+)
MAPSGPGVPPLPLAAEGARAPPSTPAVQSPTSVSPGETRAHNASVMPFPHPHTITEAPKLVDPEPDTKPTSPATARSDHPSSQEMVTIAAQTTISANSPDRPHVISFKLDGGVVHAQHGEPPTTPRTVADLLFAICAAAREDSEDGVLDSERAEVIDTSVAWGVTNIHTDEQWAEVRKLFWEKHQSPDGDICAALHRTMTRDGFRHVREAMEDRGVESVFPADHDEPLYDFEKRNIAIGYIIGLLSVILAILLDVTGVAEDLSNMAQRASCKGDCPRRCELLAGSPQWVEVDRHDDNNDFRELDVIACAVRIFSLQEFGPIQVPGIWLGAIGAVFFMVLLTWFSGWLHVRHKVKVNYTRKIVHVTGYIANVVVRFVVGSGNEIETIASLILTSAIILMVFHAFLLKPFRKRFKICRLMFAGIDRPQDRPYTLRWNTTQNAAYFITFIPLTYALIARDRYQLMLIPVLVIGFGDGLAEPVGVTWGKHKYRAHAIWYHGKCCAGHFTRSLEGSACVFIATAIAVAVCYAWWDGPVQFAVAMGVLPIACTLGEAFAPHSWDNPFLLALAGLLIILIEITIDG